MAWLATAALAAVSCGPAGPSDSAWPAGHWQRHTIDSASLGADGVRLGDVNGDGFPDVVSPWEQGGKVRLYLYPADGDPRDPWPAVTVGEVGDPEDAFLADLDGDGALDVVSACEGETRSIFVHWAPRDAARLLDPAAWTTAELPASAGLAQWMFAVPLQADGRHGADLVAGSKRAGAGIGWFEAPRDARDLAEWEWHPLYSAGWVMTIRTHDIDGDGDLDIVATDRSGPRRGALWLENPGSDAGRAGAWTEHRIGPVDDHEAMHNAIADLDGDGLDDILVAVKGGPIRFHRRTTDHPPAWETHLIEMPDRTGTGKSVEVGDIDLDGEPDIAVACEHATDGKIGVFWLSRESGPHESGWTARSISGPEGFIFDLMQLVDVDRDGDLDVMTLEEKGPYLAQGYSGSELGVIWYENPTR